MRRAARTDANQPEVVDAFRKLGCSVAILSQVGGGVPDLAVSKGGTAGYGGRMCFVEVKDGDKPPSDRQLTPDQVEFVQKWRGPVYIVENLDEVARVVRALGRDA